MLADSEEAQIYMLRALYDLWSTHHQVQILNISKSKDEIKTIEFH